MKILMGMVIVFLTISNVAYAKILEYKISNNHMNRIIFGPLVQTIGDPTKYTLITDHIKNNVFLVPKIEVGEYIDLALSNANGAIVQMKLLVADIPPQIIDLSQKDEERVQSLFSINEEEMEMSNMLKSMIKNLRGKYHVIPIDKIFSQLPTTVSGLAIVKDIVFRFKNFTGVRLKLYNSGNKKIELKTQQFSKIFENTRLISLSNNTLVPQSTSFAYIITKESK